MIKSRYTLNELMVGNPRGTVPSVNDPLEDYKLLPEGPLKNFIGEATGIKKTSKIIDDREDKAEFVAEITGQPLKEVLQKYDDGELTDIIAKYRAAHPLPHINGSVSREYADKEFMRLYELFGPKPVIFDKPKTEVIKERLTKTMTTEELIKNMINGKSSSNF